jgi:hypothetical protein
VQGCPEIGGGIDAQTDWLIANAGLIQSFGRDADGELYLITGSGKIFKIIKGPVPPA